MTSIPNVRDPSIYLFDGVCILCSASVRFVLRHERGPSVRFVALQSPEGRALAAGHGLDPDDPQSFLLIEQGQTLKASEAVLALCAHLKAPWSWGQILRVVPKAWRDGLYHLVARNRYSWFGRADTCLVPSPQQRARFSLPG
jgi:predicted DCC family thiol-disulfide oxidoreductase YuxK